MNKVSVFKISNLECISFNNYEYWEGVDEILTILKNNFNVIVIEDLEGPDSRIIKFNIDDNIYLLQYDSYGTILKPNTSKAVEFMKVMILNKFI